jgi:hypothetical protein
MNPTSLQKPASIKHFCNILFFVNALPLGLACEFFCARHARATRREPDSMVKNFFSQVGPEALAKADSSLDSTESAQR